MSRIVGTVAAGLGYSVRLLLGFLGFIFHESPQIAASLMIVYGVSLWSEPAAWVVGGVLFYLLFMPRPKEK